MRWKKLGRVYEPDTGKAWSQMYGILPTPEHIEADGIIRVYYAATDANRIGRITMPIICFGWGEMLLIY